MTVSWAGFCHGTPLGTRGGMNLYNYGANNPVSKVDHTGYKRKP